MSMKIKIVFQNDIRVFKQESLSVDDSFARLKKFIGESYHLISFSMQYLDEEKDYVTISSGADLQDAIEFSQEMNQVLKVFVKAEEPVVSNLGNEGKKLPNPNPEVKNDSNGGGDNCLVNELIKNEKFRGEFISFLSTFLVLLRESQSNDIISSFVEALSAHEIVAKHPQISHFGDYLPMIIPQIQPFLFLIASLDPASIEQLVNLFVKSAQGDNVGLPPWMNLLCGQIGGCGLKGGIFNCNEGMVPPCSFQHHGHKNPWCSFRRGHNKGNGCARKFGCRKRSACGANMCGGRGDLQSKLRADIVHESMDSLEEVFLPHQVVVKTWRVKNSGDIDWPEGISINYFGRSFNPMINGVKFPVQSLKSGEEGEVSVVCQAPEECGHYKSTWRLTSPDGQRFGEVFQFHISVVEDLGVNDEKGDENSKAKEEEEMQELVAKREKISSKLEKIEEAALESQEQDDNCVVRPSGDEESFPMKIKCDSEENVPLNVVNEDSVSEYVSEQNNLPNDVPQEVGSLLSSSNQLSDADNEFVQVGIENVYEKEMEILTRMGFGDEKLLYWLLVQHKGDVDAVVSNLIN